MDVGVMGDEGTGRSTGEDRGASGTGTTGDASMDSSASAIISKNSTIQLVMDRISS